MQKLKALRNRIYTVFAINMVVISCRFSAFESKKEVQTGKFKLRERIDSWLSSDGKGKDLRVELDLGPQQRRSMPCFEGQQSISVYSPVGKNGIAILLFRFMFFMTCI